MWTFLCGAFLFHGALFHRIHMAHPARAQTRVVEVRHQQIIETNLTSAGESKNQSVPVQLLELEAQTRGPDFNQPKVASFLRAFQQLPPMKCGAVWEVRVSMSLNDLAEHYDGYFKFNVKKVDGDQFLVSGDRWNGAQVEVPGARGARIAFSSGYKLTKPLELANVNNLKTLKQRLDAGLVIVDGSTEDGPLIGLTFEVGADYRNCWGNLQDYNDIPVCDQSMIEVLANDLSGKKVANIGSSGQSPSTVVKNMDRFIVKSTTSYKEYEMIKTVVPGFMQNLQSRTADCFSTGLAPVCAVIVEPGSATNWILQRKIELPGRKLLEVAIPDWDLKGPYFNHGAHDMKSAMGYKGWEHKDAHFGATFPMGMLWNQCGSREGTLAVVQDSLMLSGFFMTDYSLLAFQYAQEKPQDAGCHCVSKVPRFPIVVQVDADDTHPGGFSLAMGVIDYFERATRSGMDPRQLGSTMKQPFHFRRLWVQSWPRCFHLPPRTLQEITPEQQATVKAEVVLTSAGDGTYAECFTKGDRIKAIMQIKWTGALRKVQGDAMYDNVLPLKACNTNEYKGSSGQKISAGNNGVIYDFVPKSTPDTNGRRGLMLLVQFDDHDKKFFMVYPEQVVGNPRRFPVDGVCPMQPPRMGIA